MLNQHFPEPQPAAFPVYSDPLTPHRTAQYTGPIPIRCRRGVADAPQKRQVVRRLVRRKLTQRPSPPKDVLIEESSRRLPKANAEGTREETPPQTTAHAIAQAWADASPRWGSGRVTAQDLAKALTRCNPAAPETAIAQIEADWKTRKYAFNTIQHRRFHLRKLCRAIDAKLGTTLTAATQKPRKPQPRRVTITAEQLAAMLNKATPHLRMFIALMIFAALRFSEAHEIGWQNYDEENQTLTLAGKGGKTKTIPAPPEIVALLHLTPRGPGSFISLLRGRATTEQWTRKQWNRLKRKAGVPENVTPHDLRRTAAVGTYRRTLDLYAAKELLRHENLSSTAHYLTPYDAEALQKVRDDMLRGLKGTVQ